MSATRCGWQGKGAYLVLSVAPKLSSPLTVPSLVVGSYEIPMESDEMVPWENRLSVTVGTDCPVDRVPEVRSTGPIPRMPSTPWKPWAVDATPIDWFWITSSGDSVTVSVSITPSSQYGHRSR